MKNNSNVLVIAFSIGFVVASIVLLVLNYLSGGHLVSFDKDSTGTVTDWLTVLGTWIGSIGVVCALFYQAYQFNEQKKQFNQQLKEQKDQFNIQLQNDNDKQTKEDNIRYSNIILNDLKDKVPEFVSMVLDYSITVKHNCIYPLGTKLDGLDAIMFVYNYLDFIILQDQKFEVEYSKELYELDFQIIGNLINVINQHHKLTDNVVKAESRIYILTMLSHVIVQTELYYSQINQYDVFDNYRGLGKLKKSITKFHDLYIKF